MGCERYREWRSPVAEESEQAWVLDDPLLPLPFVKFLHVSRSEASNVTEGSSRRTSTGRRPS